MNHYFKIAKEVSKLSDFGSIKIGCVLVYKRIPVATGFNSKKTHPMQKEYNKYRFEGDCIGNGKIHSEIKAIISLPKWVDTRKVICYTYREDRFGNLRRSRPCKGCLAKLKELGVKEICYTTEEGFCRERIGE